RLERVRQSDWGGDLQKITFVQTNKARIPLYGSYITCNYRLNRLHLVSGTLHPAPPKAIDGLTWGNTGWLEAKSIALRNLPPEIEPVRFDTPHDLTLESRRQNLLVDRWILPYLPPDAAEGVYRPIWRVIIVDQNEERWLTLVDAETQEVLSHEPDRVDTTVQADVYRTALDALNDQPAPETLDYGGGNTIFNADHIHAAGLRLVEPSGPNALNADRLLSATMFYQTRQMQHAFKTMLNNLSFSLSVTATNPDPTEDINTMLENIAGSAFYRPSTHTIHLPTGVAANPPILAVHEPGIDSEVICHEFTHAVTHFLEPGVFKFKSQYTPIGQLQRKFTGALDEGLAFFLGCIVGSNQRWADSAYRDWATAANGGPWRDLHLGPKSIAEAENNGDPAGVVHALGMWWAGIFLELSQDNNLGLDATLELVLTSFDALSGPIHDELVFANTLVQHGTNNAQKTAIRNVLQAFGVNLA
ncbi:MAG: hypothetical protein ACE5G8_13345, partial [Anaerolineae bacterium]